MAGCYFQLCMYMYIMCVLPTIVHVQTSGSTLSGAVFIISMLFVLQCVPVAAGGGGGRWSGDQPGGRQQAHTGTGRAGYRYAWWAWSYGGLMHPSLCSSLQRGGPAACYPSCVLPALRPPCCCHHPTLQLHPTPP